MVEQQIPLARGLEAGNIGMMQQKLLYEHSMLRSK
jgi:hypothetical protein